jgi:uroporphyrinogen decarboxylase
MPKETMTPRERWLAVLDRETPDRLPMDYWATGEANDKLMKHLGCGSLEAVYERLHIDAPIFVGPGYVGPRIPLGEDTYGCRFEWADYGSGRYLECTHHPLAEFQTLDEIERGYDRWPDPDWYDYSVIPSQVRGKEMRPIRGGGSEPFLTYTFLRGQQQALIDLVDSPEMVHFCLDQLFGFCYENTRRIYEQAHPRVPDSSDEADDRSGSASWSFRISSQRRSDPEDPSRHDRCRDRRPESRPVAMRGDGERGPEAGLR